MDDRIIRFISALRAGGARVSLAESSDAFRAVQEMGVKDREGFRLGLRATLIKNAEALPVFDELFPLFFDGADAPPMMDVTEEMSAEEASMLAQALRMFGDHLREMMERLLRGEQLSQEELRQLGQMFGLDRTDDLRYREWMARRMMQGMRFDEVRDAMRDISELLAQMGMSKQRLEQIQEMIQANQQAMEDQISQYAGQQIAENMSEQFTDSNERLMNTPFKALSDSDMAKLRHEVQRLANRLRSRVSLRMKRAKSGHLDAKATIRANMKYGAVPVEIKHRSRKLKPKLVVICDISTSMLPCAELMLSMIYALQDVITKTHAFAFNDHLEYISPDFVGNTALEALDQVLIRMPPGSYITDLGFSLERFAQEYMDTVDNRTTVIVVGDARNNFKDPRLDIFKQISRRSRRTIWLNPEAPFLWGNGDSDMLEYLPYSDNVLVAATLNELTDAVDQMLM